MLISATVAALTVTGLAAPSTASAHRRGFADSPADAGYVSLRIRHTQTFTVAAHHQVNLTLKGLPVTDVVAVTVGLTVMATTTGSVTLWPAGTQRPRAVTAAFAPGTTAASTAVAQGKLSLLNSSPHTVSVVLSAQGYYPSATKAFASGAPGWFVPASASKAVSVRLLAHKTVTYNALLGAPARVAAVVLAVSATATKIGSLKSFAFHSSYKTSTSLPLVAGKRRQAVEVVQPSGASHLVGLSNLSAGPTSVTAASVGYIQPFGAAGPPQNVKATAGTDTAVVTWDPPVVLGGLPVTSYAVSVYPHGPTEPSVGAPITVLASQHSLTISTAAGSYWFGVAATTAWGVGPTSIMNLPVRVVRGPVPGAPQHLTAAATGIGQVTLNWSPPAVNTGLPLTSYTVDALYQSQFVVPAAATSAVVPLRAGLTTYVSITADNADGRSQPAVTGPLTVLGVPDTLMTTRVSTAIDPRATTATQLIAGERPAVSRGGRYVAFTSAASNLVPGDTNAARDVFVRDLVTGTTTRVSIATDGSQSNDNSYGATVSDDGRFVSFESFATTLAPGAADGLGHIYRHDVLTGTTAVVSLTSTGAVTEGYEPSMSADGTRVAFGSPGLNVVPGDTNGTDDIFVRDLTAGTTVRASLGDTSAQLTDFSEGAALSPDGNVVAFSTGADNVVTGWSGNAEQTYVRNLSAGTTTAVSQSPAGVAGDDDSFSSALSADGRYVAFESAAGNLVAGDTNTAVDVFVRDMQTGTTSRLSVATGGAQTFGKLSFDPVSLSSDGRRVAFTFPEQGLVPTNDNGRTGTFVHDLSTGATTETSVSGGGDQASTGAAATGLSPDGSYAAFAATLPNQVDFLNVAGIFLRHIG
jgi:hypothetical protein